MVRRAAIGIDVVGDAVHSISVDVRSGAVITDRVEIVGIGIACTDLPPLRIDQIVHSLHLKGAAPVVTTRRREHARVPGAGVASPSTLVLSFQDGIHLMNSRTAASAAGVVGPDEDFILPGYFAYELRQRPLDESSRDRRAIESAAFELRALCDSLRRAGVQVRRFVAAGQAERENPLLMQIFADILDARIRLAANAQPILLGAAILGALAAGSGKTGHASMSQTIHAMASQRRDVVYRPDVAERKRYDQIYAQRSAAGEFVPSKRARPLLP